MALSYLRRHRRWLFGFLWLVIRGLHHPLHPGLPGRQRGIRPPKCSRRLGGQEIKVSEFERTYRQQVGFYERMSQAQGRSLTPEMLRRMGLEEQVFQGLVEEQILALEADRLGDERDRRGRGSRAPDLPGLPGRWEIHGRRRAASAPLPAGTLRGGLRRGTALASQEGPARGHARRRGRGERRRSGGRVPSARGAGQGRVRSGRSGAVPRERSR